jgi:hypothetical protein
MRDAGFARRGDQYESRQTELFVEFPAGPLAIGDDVAIKPRSVRRGNRTMEMLSATDSCRDRLAAWFHWNDRQSLAAAVAIARLNRVSMSRIRAWSRSEGASDKFNVFITELRPRRLGSTPRKKKRT